ncbi:MAG: universal stress protein [Candidatus Binatia bacterium]
MKIKRILVPVDFSAPSQEALEYAAELAKPFSAELVALFVIEPIYYAGTDYAALSAGSLAGLVDEQRRSARAELERLEKAWRKRRLTLRTVTQTGTPYRVIVDSAKRLKADLIVMATHGRTGMSHLLMGSVSERVVRSAACPVLTLHAGPRRRRAPARRR